MTDRIKAVLWFLALAFLFLTSLAAVLPYSISGPMNIRLQPPLFMGVMMVVVPLSTCIRQSGTLGWTRAIGVAMGINGLWWIFWAPASMTDISFSQRYDTDDFTVPSEAATQSLVLACSAWLITVRREANVTSGVLRLLCFGLLTVLAARTAEPLAQAWEMTSLPWIAGALALLLLSGGWVWVRPRNAAGWALSVFLGLQCVVVCEWLMLYHHYDHLPPSINAFGRDLI